jgi:predicted small secreted protein
MRKLFVLSIALVLTGLTVSACENTVKGFGQDMERNGQEIQGK